MRRLGLAAMAALVSTVALADWSDNFDSYSNGQQLHGVGGWTGWDNSAGAGALVTNVQSSSAPHSADIVGGSDLVQQFSGYTSGSWTFLSRVFIPENFTGSSFFIMLNQYNHGGPYNWSIQSHFDAATNTFADDFNPVAAVPFTRGVWNDLRVFINLDANTRTMYLNGNVVSQGNWTTDANSLVNIGAIDLFANGAGSVFYDDMQLVPEPATMSVLALGALALLRRRRQA